MRRTIREHGPHPVDVHVGSRVRQRRSLLGLSQTQLADLLGLTFQQVQKNERGSNRIGGSRLYQLSQILDVPISYFFERIPETVSAGAKSDAPIAESQPSDPDVLFKRETLEFVRAYYRINNEKVRNRLLSLVREVVRSGGRG